MIVDFIKNACILAAISVILCEYLSKITKANGFFAQFQSWVVAIIVAFVANAFGFGFGSISWFTSILLGIFVGLVANGIFKIPWMQTILVWIKARIKPAT